MVEHLPFKQGVEGSIPSTLIFLWPKDHGGHWVPFSIVNIIIRIFYIYLLVFIIYKIIIIFLFLAIDFKKNSLYLIITF